MQIKQSATDIAGAELPDLKRLLASIDDDEQALRDLADQITTIGGDSGSAR